MLYDGLTPASLAARLRAPGCLSLVSVTSTMDIIHELAGEGAPAGTVVVADEQVSGRGRQGRRWHSPAGKGVWLGFLLRPARAADPGVLSLRVGLAVAEALERCGTPVALKWPNDVLLRERKVAGILCEARWSADRLAWVAVGVGINVHGPLPDELARTAIALDEVVPGAGRVPVLEALVPRLQRLSDQPSLSQDERDAWARCDWLSGRRLTEPVPGIARGVDEGGALLVERDGTVGRVVAGTVVCC
jgi:BirA family biotin operon repressor/biotin-[acetyl-CoA-carboxylase] ligase